MACNHPQQAATLAPVRALLLPPAPDQPPTCATPLLGCLGQGLALCRRWVARSRAAPPSSAHRSCRATFGSTATACWEPRQGRRRRAVGRAPMVAACSSAPTCCNPSAALAGHRATSDAARPASRRLGGPAAARRQLPGRGAGAGAGASGGQRALAARQPPAGAMQRSTTHKQVCPLRAQLGMKQ